MGGVRCCGLVVNGVGGFGNGADWGSDGGVVLVGNLKVWVLGSSGVVMGEICCVFLGVSSVWKWLGPCMRLLFGCDL